ncbi:aldo/keto reductase [Streptomyces olivoreticuli]|nr:aldo/keto reductase [Streptomyces olivoreticuli]WKK24259.1 aldo/keto reductase [Streptomyces olivoreticuli]
MLYRPLGASGLKISAITLRLGPEPEDRNSATARYDTVRHALQHGITHYTLAPNLPSSPSRGTTQILPSPLQYRLRRHRDQIVLSAHPPYGFPWPECLGLNSRKHLTTALDGLLASLETDYMDLFCAYRYDPRTPLNETAAALADAVHHGKALHVGVAAWAPAPTRTLAALLNSHGVPLTAHQSAFSLTRPQASDGLLETLHSTGTGCIAHLPHRSRPLQPHRSPYGPPAPCSAETDHPADLPAPTQHALRQLATARGQTLPQLAVSWALQQPTVSSTAVTACHPSCLNHHLYALNHLTFTPDEHIAISTLQADRHQSPADTHHPPPLSTQPR